MLSLHSDVAIPSDLDAAGAQQDRDRRAVRRAAAPQRQRPPLKNGDVIPADRTTVPPDINALAATRPTAACRRSRTTTSRPSSTRATPRSADWARTRPAGQRVHHTGDRRPRQPRPAHHSDRQAQAGAGHPDRHRRFHPGVGRAPRPPSPTSCRPTTPRSAGCSRRVPRPPTRPAQLFDRLQPTLPIAAGQPGQPR